MRYFRTDRSQDRLLYFERSKCTPQSDMHRPSISTQLITKEPLPAGVRVGCDVIQESRISDAIQRRGSGFAELLFRANELSAEEVDNISFETRFTLKESTLKALGRGLSGNLNLGHVDTEGEKIKLLGPAAKLAGDVSIKYQTSLSNKHVRTCVWLVPNGDKA